MKLLSNLLLYLDEKAVLSKMKTSLQSYLSELTEVDCSKFPPFRFILELDVLDLLDSSYDVGNWVLKEPMQFKRACSDILFACHQCMNDDNKTVQPAQVAVEVRLKCVPRLVKRNPRNYTGLTTFNGILLSVSKPDSYVYHTVWSCPEECEGNEVILHYIPKVPPKCYICKAVLFENSGMRRCGEYVIATFKCKGGLTSKKVAIVDDLIPKLKLGVNFNIHVVAIKKKITIWGLEEVIPLPAPMTSPIPPDIKDLDRICKGVPWQFIYCLASSIGVNVCPLHCFMHVKISMLMSLTSVKANAYTGSSILHVLVAGYDTGYVSQLMQEGARLAERAICLGTTNSTVSTALIGSSGGVCVLPLPLHIYNQKQTSAILSSIESGEVSTDTVRVKLQSAVWAQGMDFKKMSLLNIGSVFGAVCRGDYGESSDEIADFILQNSVEPTGTSAEEVEALKDVVNYIDLVAGLDVYLDKRTEKLLRNYFLAARRESPRGVGVGSMGALVAACLTSARLCRRRATEPDDAVFVIWLNICGSPDPRFAPEEYLQTPADVKTLHKMMEAFKNWLEQFTGSYIS